MKKQPTTFEKLTSANGIKPANTVLYYASYREGCVYRPNNHPSSNLPGRPILNRVILSGNDDWQDGWDDGCLLHKAVLCSMMRRSRLEMTGSGSAYSPQQLRSGEVETDGMGHVRSIWLARQLPRGSFPRLKLRYSDLRRSPHTLRSPLSPPPALPQRDTLIYAVVYILYGVTLPPSHFSP